uniref:EF-hand domain-containing protein n=2 Tax=Hordeum vulgare subsp. vulgare TaxID=112509 RepID=A0A8I6WXX2_HORVV
MDKSPATAGCHLEPLFLEPLGILILFILTWFISEVQRLLPSSCQSCSCPVSTTTSPPVLAETSKAPNKSEYVEMNAKQSDAEIAMRKMGFDFDQEKSCEHISTLFDDDEPSFQEVKMAFLVFDENNDGYIDALDLRRVLHNLGLGDRVGVSESEQMIARYDMNNDRRIDLMEFTKVLEDSFC